MPRATGRPTMHCCRQIRLAREQLLVGAYAKCVCLSLKVLSMELGCASKHMTARHASREFCESQTDKTAYRR